MNALTLPPSWAPHSHRGHSADSRVHRIGSTHPHTQTHECTSTVISIINNHTSHHTHLHTNSSICRSALWGMPSPHPLAHQHHLCWFMTWGQQSSCITTASNPATSTTGDAGRIPQLGQIWKHNLEPKLRKRS